MSQPKSVDRAFSLPPVGENPSTDCEGTTPGSFASPGRVGTPWTFSSPDAPGMPDASDVTAMDFARDLDRQGKTQLEEARDRPHHPRDEARRHCASRISPPSRSAPKSPPAA